MGYAENAAYLPADGQDTAGAGKSAGRYRGACAFGTGSSLFGGTWKCAEGAGLRKEYQGRLQPGIFQDAGNTGRMPEGYSGRLWKQYESGYRKIIDLHPDAILLSPFENSGGYGRVGKLGVPVIECADYMETSPLGRAEWLRFYGLLVGQAQKGDSLFAQIEKEYLAVKALAAKATFHPTVLSDLKYGSAWYIAGGQSTTGCLYADAGAAYVFAALPNSGSVPMAFETVFDKGENADFWLIKYNQSHDKTYRELQKDYSLYARFKAFRERRIYGCNTHRIPFYEESPFHPEVLLKDMVKSSIRNCWRDMNRNILVN